MNKKTVIVAGASGLIGKEAVQQLILDPTCEEIILLVRKASTYKHSKIREIYIDFTDSVYHLDNIKADSLLICIGTTMKQARTKESFKEVDLQIPVKLAHFAKKSQIHHVSVISAMGADPKSVFFYNRVKGEMELQLMSLHLPSLSIVRPSLLIGDREEFRLGERFAEKIYKTFPFIFPKKYQPIEASKVAKVMINEISSLKEANVNIIENRLIHEISRNI